MDSFFDVLPPDDEDAYAKWIEGLNLAEISAWSSPLQRDTKITPYSRFLANEVPNGSLRCSRRHPGCSVFEETELPTFVFQEPLSHGYPKWAQVWRAMMLVPNCQVEVVLKVFQESFALRPATLRAFQAGKWFSGASQAKNEAWAYKKLAELQGKLIILT
jgi:hypothetical protein